MKHTLLALSLLTLMACSDNKAADLTEKQQAIYAAQPLVSTPTTNTSVVDNTTVDEGYSTGEMVVAGVAGVTVGALAANALSSNSSREVEKCDWDDHPNEPECRGTSKYYKWKREQDAKKRAELAKKRKAAAMKKKRKPQ
jgi:hypothetical protein